MNSQFWILKSGCESYEPEAISQKGTSLILLVIGTLDSKVLGWTDGFTCRENSVEKQTRKGVRSNQEDE